MLDPQGGNVILRKLAGAIRDQNWFTVVLEVLIVVVGIFVGLRVDDWNQRRIDRQIGVQYLENIRIAVEADIAMLAEFENRVMGRRSAAEAVLAAVNSGAYEDAGLFIRQVDRAGRFTTPIYQRAAYEDMVATGNARMIKAILRGRLHEYYRQQLRYDVGADLQEQRVFQGYLPIAVDALPLDSQRWIYDVLGQDMTPLDGPPFLTEHATETLSKLRSNTDVVGGLKGVIRGTWSQENNMRAVRELAMQMKGELDTSIGVTRAP
jgi:hypothetical protein